ncbi:hypothetical protein [Mycolicibacterium frederiksbergense]|uniref:hypothetical protein n=1 Tax=Mycolicibacterium frederiksbergense TaxID=117567 RepID=UPI002475D5A5|nr:hypothetical protein [Mycolicibacterium frederiksbergense]
MGSTAAFAGIGVRNGLLATKGVALVAFPGGDVVGVVLVVGAVVVVVGVVLVVGAVVVVVGVVLVVVVVVGAVVVVVGVVAPLGITVTLSSNRFRSQFAFSAKSLVNEIPRLCDPATTVAAAV